MITRQILTTKGNNGLLIRGVLPLQRGELFTGAHTLYTIRLQAYATYHASTNCIHIYIGQ